MALVENTPTAIQAILKTECLGFHETAQAMRDILYDSTRAGNLDLDHNFGPTAAHSWFDQFLFGFGERG